MQEYQTVFQRREIKYLLKAEQYTALLQGLEPYMQPDHYGKTTVHSLYYDTDDYRLIRASIEKPVYKEKLRLRAYGNVTPESLAFVELKKKYRGIVYKRRVAMPLSDAYAYLSGAGTPPEKTQIHREIDWFLAFYKPSPAVMLSYDRIAFTGRREDGVRITFDSNLRWQDDALRLEARGQGSPLLPPAVRLMEVKVPDAMPLWLCALLTRFDIYPSSFSKYGTYYKTQILTKNGGIVCA